MSDPAPGEAHHLVVREVSKRFGAVDVLNCIDLDIERGELVTLLGPSGCGKTTLLRTIAGLEALDQGRITIAGRDVTRVPPHQRNVGVVFQNYALFPHLTVAGNVAFGLNVRKKPRAEVEARVKRVLALVRLEALADRPISALSGGQQQRVALARAIAIEPDVILFDEALSALDRKLREDMQIELRRLLQEVRATAVFVTHDQDEALTMSDRVAVMYRGEIEQCAKPRDIYARPATLFTLRFVGLSTQIAGTVAADGDGMVHVDTPAGRLRARGSFRPGSPVVIATRPENIRTSETSDGALNQVSGQVHNVVFHGSRTLVEIDAGCAAPLLAELPGQGDAPGAGDPIRVVWPAEQTFAYPDSAVVQ